MCKCFFILTIHVFFTNHFKSAKGSVFIIKPSRARAKNELLRIALNKEEYNMKTFKNMNEIIKAENGRKKNIRIYIATLLAVQMLMLPISSCSSSSDNSQISGSASAAVATLADVGGTEVSTVKKTSSDSLNADELFTERDLIQSPDLSGAKELTLKSGSNITISEAGVYRITGSAENATIIINAGDEDKVQIVLDGVSIENSDFPCVYVKNADKVFITLTGDNLLSVTGKFTSDTDTDAKTDGVIFSKDDITLNGIGSLTISSSDNGIVSKDDLKITGGTYNITAASKAIEANDSIRISDGSFTIKAGTDGLHTENEDDGALGYIFIGGGSFTMSAGDDGIHAVSLVQIDGGSFEINAAECIEGTYIRINDGKLNLSSWDDGINAANKSSAFTPTVEINGGEINITMSAGDTDGIDSNGNIIINGGTISVSGNSTFDYDGTAEFNGGTIYVNGQQVTEIPNQMMGGGRGGMGMGGGRMGGRRG